MDKNLKIAILVETSTTWGRRVCQGIGNWCKLNPGWMLYLEPHGENEKFFLPDGWQGDGIIARINSIELADNVKSAGVPVVNVSGQRLEGADFYRVAPDDRRIVAHAFEHLLERGVRNFAFSGYTSYYDKRYAVTEEFLRGQGFSCAYNPESGTWSDRKWMSRLQKTAEWLETLPKPTGILAWGTVEGRHIADACHYAGLKVPEDILIIGWDFDDLIGDMISPSISGITLPTVQQGFEAAALLHMLINNEIPAQKEIALEPMGVITRDSTDFSVINDEDVRKAVAFIKNYTDKGIDVSDVVDIVKISRRTLERRFTLLVGRSPADEIRRVRFEKAKDLLIKTSMSVAEIAQASGWKYAEQMIPYFKEKTGLTPAEFRKKIQSR